MKIIKIVGSNLKRYRTEAGMTLEDLGAAIGSTRQAIWSIENEKNWISIGTIEKISKALQIEEHLLFQIDTTKLK